MQPQTGQVFDDLVTGLVSVIRIFRHHLVDDQIKALRDFRTQRSGLWINPFLFSQNEFKSRIAGEWKLAGQHVIQSCPQRIDITAVVDVLGVASLLRCHVKWRAESRAALGHGNIFVHDFCEAKVGHFDNALFRNEHVVRLNVTMNHVLRMSMLQRFRADHGDVNRIGNGEFAQMVQPLLYALAINVFDRGKVNAFVRIDSVDLHDIRMIYFRHRLGFSLKSSNEVGFLGELFCQSL